MLIDNPLSKFPNANDKCEHEKTVPPTDWSGENMRAICTGCGTTIVIGTVKIINTEITLEGENQNDL